MTEPSGVAGDVQPRHAGREGAPWWAPLECPICHATDGKCEHTFEGRCQRAAVMRRLWDLAYQHGQSIHLDLRGGHGGPSELVYLGGLRIAEGPDWMEQVMAFPRTPAASSTEEDDRG